MTKFFTLFLAAALFIFTSCGVSKTTSYGVSLSAVESPSDAKVKYGDTKIVSFEEEGQSKYRYEDDYISMSWYVGSKQFFFTLKNNSDYSIKIPWDDIVYVDAAGDTKRIMHSGVKYIDRNASQPASVVPKNASISDILLPTDNVYYVSGQYGGWRERYLFPRYDSQEAASQSSMVGKKVRILFPIIIQDVQNEYTFEFTINDVTVK